MEIRLDEGDDRVAVVCVGGDVDAAGAAELQATAVAALARAGPAAGDLVLDVSGVEFMGSAGLSALLHLQSLLRRAGRSLRLVEPSGPVRRLLEITGTAADLLASPAVGTGDPPPVWVRTGPERVGPEHVGTRRVSPEHVGTQRVGPRRVSPQRRGDPPGADRRA